MKTLYISDLDGTLLRNNGRVSDFTKSAIESLTDRGMLFLYATSRSEVSSSIALSRLTPSLPVIVYNGAAIVKPGSGEVIFKNNFSKPESDEILDKLISAGVYPVVYSFIDGADKFSFIYDMCTAPERDYINTKTPDDRRLRPVNTVDELRAGDVFYFTCIGRPEILLPLYRHFEHRFRCLYEINRYTGEQWLEIMPKGVSKANAAKTLKKFLSADRIVSFGDGINDRELFEASELRYAVSNACDDLKALATGIIKSNEEDGVAKFLLEHFKEDE